MRTIPRLFRLMLRAFSGNEFKFLMLLFNSPKGPYHRIALSIGEIERGLSVRRPTAIATKVSLEQKGVIRSKVITDRARTIPITAYEVDEKALQSYVSLFEIRCRHCGTTTAPTYIKHPKLSTFALTVTRRIITPNLCPRKPGKENAWRIGMSS
jgi:hypothetical protein